MFLFSLIKNRKYSRNLHVNSPLFKLHNLKTPTEIVKIFTILNVHIFILVEILVYTHKAAIPST